MAAAAAAAAAAEQAAAAMQATTLTPAEVDRIKATAFDLERALRRVEQMRKDSGFTEGQMLRVLFRQAADACMALKALPLGSDEV